jgi:hypothetical protein
MVRLSLWSSLVLFKSKTTFCWRDEPINHIIPRHLRHMCEIRNVPKFEDVSS